MTHTTDKTTAMKTRRHTKKTTAVKAIHTEVHNSVSYTQAILASSSPRHKRLPPSNIEAIKKKKRASHQQAKSVKIPHPRTPRTSSKHNRLVCIFPQKYVRLQKETSTTATLASPKQNATTITVHPSIRHNTNTRTTQLKGAPKKDSQRRSTARYSQSHQTKKHKKD